MPYKIQYKAGMDEDLRNCERFIKDYEKSKRILPRPTAKEYPAGARVVDFNETEPPAIYLKVKGGNLSDDLMDFLHKGEVSVILNGKIDNGVLVEEKIKNVSFKKGKKPPTPKAPKNQAPKPDAPKGSGKKNNH